MKVLNGLSAILFYVAAFVCLPVILVVLTLDVTLRFGFNAPLGYAEELASVLLFLTVVLALPQAWLRGAHVRAEFLSEIIGPKAREAIARGMWLLVLCVSVVLVWQCWRDAQFMLMINESTQELYIPLAYLRGALALGAAVSGAIALAKLVSLKRVGEIHELDETAAQ